MLLVVPDILGVGLVDIVLHKLVLAIAAVHELAIAEIEVHLQPSFRIGHGPEVVGAEVHLWDGLGVRTFHKRACRE